MNRVHHISNQADLEQLIRRYFDGETSLQQEQQLREALAHCPWDSEIIDEARFTMGYFAAHAREQRLRDHKVDRKRIMGIAASIAVILTVGGYVIWHQQSADDVCIASVNGKIINNDEAVMALIEKDLSTMEDASHSMATQLSSLGEAIELDNN